MLDAREAEGNKPYRWENIEFVTQPETAINSAAPAAAPVVPPLSRDAAKVVGVQVRAG